MFYGADRTPELLSELSILYMYVGKLFQAPKMSSSRAGRVGRMNQ